MCRLEVFETLIPIGKQKYNLAVLLSTGSSTSSASDNGSGLLGEGVASLKEIVDEAEAFARVERRGIIYLIGG